VLTAVTVLALSGCASNSGSSDQAEAKPKPEKKEKPAKDTRPKEDRLKVGMTMDEVIQAIGKPKGKSVSSDGTEIWNYNDAEKAWIPYYSMSGGKFHNITVVFDADGKVKSWSTNAQGIY
jgi:outer membrane protein assembly factor BamE (lipoprotein component of BamABCDE complex)